MGPNLRRLFQDRKDAPYPENMKAAGELRQLFSDHGEALIAALEGALRCFEVTQRVKDYPTDHWAPKAKQLLAQLESEAQP